MNKITTTFFILLITICTSYGQSFDKIKLDNKQSILNDRAFFNFPTEAKNESRATNIMSADHNINVETRIVLDINNMHLVFFAQELFALGSEDLLAEVSKNKDDKLGLKTQALTDKDHLLSILSTPTIFDSTANAILVNSLLVKTEDNTLFRISAYINPEAFKLKDNFIELTKQVFQTLSKGTRTNDRKAREESLGIFGTKKNFKFILPKNYSITVDQKYDFQVFKFQKYQNLSETNWIQLIIYVGHHPSDIYKDYGLSKSDGKKSKGKFLGKDLKWNLFDINKAGFFDKEQKISCDNIEEGLIVHIAMLSNQQNLLNELTEIVESIELTK